MCWRVCAGIRLGSVTQGRVPRTQATLTHPIIHEGQYLRLHHHSNVRHCKDDENLEILHILRTGSQRTSVYTPLRGRLVRK